MRILVLSFYYPPDLSAGSFRATSIVDALHKLAPAGTEIDVITTLPNRYHSFTVEAPRAERHGDVSIRRIALPKHRSGLLDQGLAALTFFRGAVREAKGKEYDIVFATSGRLMTAVLGSLLSRRTKAPLYLDIRDIFVETIADLSLRRVSWLAKGFFSRVEAWAVNRAVKVNLVSRGFADYFRGRYPRQHFSFYPNGIDDEFLAITNAKHTVANRGPANGALTVLYAGNIGEGQGLHSIIPELAQRMGPRLHFRIIGDGGRRHALEAAVSRSGVKNVELERPVRRDELVNAYCTADVVFLHLNDYAALTRVLPSKLFEYAASGKPVWAGVSGYTASFIRSEITNAAVFHPCDVDGAVRAFDTLRLEHTPRPAFLKSYARSAISQAMAADILTLATSHS